MPEADGIGGGFLVYVLVAAFALTVCCAGLCASLSWFHTSRRYRETPVTGYDGTAYGVGTREATCVIEHVQVTRLNGNVFQIERAKPESSTSSSAAAVVGGELSPEACEICCEQSSVVVLSPCGHGGLCKTCANQILMRSGHHCPHCRGFAAKVIVVQSPKELLVSRSSPGLAYPTPLFLDGEKSGSAAQERQSRDLHGELLHLQEHRERPG
mmetsp:Transcript_89208/g.251104  ORF Transcript_89208/g.251104 Transcript_89208/m.251104 type:complete len:212 (+) Transcript_89208:127-762(+)